MKKLVFSIVAGIALLGAQNVLAEGAIFLSNFGNGSTIADTPIKLANGTTDAPSFFVQIWGGTSAGNLAPIAAVSGGATTFSQNAGNGFFDFGTGVIPGLADGGTGFFEVRAWSGGGSFDTAAFRGTSGVFSQATGTGPQVGPPASPGNPAILNIPGNSIVLAAVPEPTTIALAVMGGLGLLARRRRNA